jgi:tetratricopeptide (TPR) repeat protein
VNFQLMVGVRGKGRASGSFGTILNDGMRPDVPAMVDVFLTDPTRVDIWKTAYAEELKNFDAAARGYETLGARLPDEEVAFQRAEAAFWAQDWALAASSYRAAIDAKVEVARSYKGLGWAMFNAGDADRAIAAWHEAIALFERRGDAADRGHLADCYKGIALAASSSGDCETARDASVVAARLAPSVAATFQLVGECGGQQ